MTRKHLVVVALAFAAAALVSILARQDGASAQDTILGVVIGGSFVVSGLVAWVRRPGNAIGPLMVLTGFLQMGAVFCTDAASQAVVGAQDASRAGLLYPAGHLLHLASLVAVGWVLLAFPTGRLDRAGRRVLALALLVTPLRLSWLLLGGDGKVPDSIALAHNADAALLVDRAETVLGLVVASLIIIVLVRRWQRASEHFRFAIAPVLWAGAAAFAVLVLYLLNPQLGEPFGAAPMVLLNGVLAGVAVGFLIGLLRARLARSAVAELVVELGQTAEPGHLRDALARALRDPSLTLVYWLPEGQRYVDVTGRPITLPAGDRSRTVTVVERDGQRVGALVHDPALAENPRLVQSVCAAAALALENERLEAELRARLDDLQASRARIVEAADEERRRIERNLHDGTQQRLVSLSMALGLAQAKLRSDPAAAETVFAQARQGLGAALEELRELSRGIHPGILTERGLAAALDELALRATMPVQVAFAADGRLPEQVEATAYYVVCEALANSAKYAQADAARVHVEGVDGKLTVEVTDNGVGGADVSRGTGLRGLRDRVEALGGRLWFSSPAGEGTILRAEIPCG